MAGILDILDDPGALSRVLGFSVNPGTEGWSSSPQQQPGMPPQPPQPPQQQAPQPPQPAPSFVQTPDYAPAPPIDFNATAGAMGADPTVAALGSQPQPQPSPAAPPPQAPAPPSLGGGVPLPVPAPQPKTYPPQVALPPNAAPAAGAPPMAAAPAPRPPASQFENVPTASVAGGGIAGAFGIGNPPLQRAMLAGVGKGLTAVGHQPLGTSKGAAFAAGAGGSLEGMVGQENKHFDQLSTAFKDMLAAKNSDNTEGYRAAQSQYLAARAQSLQAMTAAGGKGSNAWQNTPYGKVIQVENEAQKYEKGQQILLQKRWSLNGSTEQQQQEDLERLNKNVDGYRERLYKQAGVDPKQADKLKNMGTAADNPFDTKGMTIEQFHAQVPMGGWFKDQNGVVRQRTVPPPNAGGGAAEQPQAPGPGAAANADDMAAMSPAA